MISYWERLLDGSETVLGPFEHGTWWFWERLLAKWERQLAKWERHLDQFEYGTCPSYSSGTNLFFLHFQYIHVKYIQTAFLLIKDRIDSRHGLTPAGNYLIWQLLTPAGVKSFLEAMVIVMKTILSGLHIFFFFTLGPKGRKGIVITFVCLCVCLCVCPYEFPENNFYAACRIVSKLDMNVSLKQGINWLHFQTYLINFGFLVAERLRKKPSVIAKIMVSGQ